MTIDQELFGLVLAGGKSTRMGKDKAAIVYSDKPQYQHAFELLEKVCGRVFISSRADQGGSAFEKYPQIHDRPEYQGKGPLSGILSAMHAYPDVSWLVLACDLPFVTIETLNYLITNRSRKAAATAYKSQIDGLPEPLCAIWEAGHLDSIAGSFSQGIMCPRKILIQCQAHLVDIQTSGEMDNINNPSEAAQALERIRIAK